MKQTLKGQEVLLVKEPQNSEVKAVSGIDEGGALRSVPANRQHESDFLKIDRQSNALENFFSNFMRQVKEPTHFGFFKVQLEGVEQSADIINRQYAGAQDDIEGEAFSRDAQVKPQDYIREQGQSYKSYNVDSIDWKAFEELGIKREQLEKSGALEPMLNYRKSPNLMNISINLNGSNIYTQGRLSLREVDGRIVPVVHAIRKEPQLDRPYFGHTFTDADKDNLKRTGNMGRVVELVNSRTGEVTPSLVSIDQLTNEIVTMRADKIKIPNEIKGVALSAEQQADLRSGKALYLEGMTAKSGKPFDAYVQVNADRRGIEFRFNGERQQKSQSQSQSSSGEFRIPNKLGGVALTTENKETLKSGGTIYMEGLKNQRGESYNAYIKVNSERGKLDFYNWNPDKKREQAQAEPSQEPQQQKSRGVRM